MTSIQIILSIISGGMVGFTLGLLGGGGSILAVPLLLYIVGIKDTHIVIGSTAFAVAINAYLNLIPHAKADQVCWKPALAFAIPGTVGAFLGSTLGKFISSKQVLFLFAIFMMFMAIKMILSKKQRKEVSYSNYQVKYTILITIATLVGVLSGFFGIGGGFLIVPALGFSANLTMTESIGSSLLSVGTFGLTTAVNYSLSGLVDWWIVMEFVGGGMIGGTIGALLTKRLSKNQRILNYIFSSVVMIVAIYMLFINAISLDI
ncbi:sulfite exporter TauE/SafE family protein [Priestia aryabhattai]|uniref:sulfite exporter TauE/SafE family protein n=1 Tax=Priestia aryabhattai TaxID=412384 RepID=UPI003982D4BA